MPRHEFPIIVLAALLGSAASAHADPSDYGKVDTFQPGKKYNCVPTADRKGWDCSVTGTADVQPSAPPAAPPAQTPAAPVHETAPAAAPQQPAPRASELPKYITGGGVRIPKGTMLLDTRFFAPSGGEFTEFTFNGKPRANNGVLFDTRPTNFAAFPLKPGQTVTIDATMTTAKDQRPDAVVSTTPGARSTPNGVIVPSACH